MKILILCDITTTDLLNNIGHLNKWADYVFVLTDHKELWKPSDSRTIICTDNKFTVLELVNAMLDLCEEQAVKDVDVVFCGEALETVVLSNAIAMNGLFDGLRIIIATDASRGSSEKQVKRALKVMKNLNISLMKTKDIIKLP